MPEEGTVTGNTSVRGVDARLRLDEAIYPVEPAPMGPTPHVRDMLGVWLPRQKPFFQSDLHIAPATGALPPDDRRASECWFARWAVANLPADPEVLCSHTQRRTSVAALAPWASAPGSQAYRAQVPQA